MRSVLPPGYERSRVGRTIIAAPPAATAWLQDAIRTHDTLHAHALAHADVRLGGGRGVVAVATTPLGTWAVRHYHRGGAVARVAGDRYLRGGTPRPLRELAVSAALRERGVATPEVMAAVVYPNAAWYRGDLATVYVADAADLAALTLSAERWPEADRLPAWRAAGSLLRAFFATGAEHVDLNLRNILVARAGGAQLLDLDRCTLPGRVRPEARARMLARFHRSRRKLERQAGRTVGPAELHALEAELAA